MKIDKLVFNDDRWNLLAGGECIAKSIDIVFVFAHKDTLKSYNHSKSLKKKYPNAYIVGCSTAGNILDSTVDAYKAVASAVSFDSGYISVVKQYFNLDTISQDTNSLINMLNKNQLKHIFLLAPGLINGSDIVAGVDIDENITISGGLAGDEDKYQSTYLLLDGEQGDNLLIAVGFYGESIHVRVGCETGWEEFGARRVVTKSYKNIVYEIDNRPAIELYERYLGDMINELPNSSLRFPLSIKRDIHDLNEVIRVIMHINEDGSLVFAGDIQVGSIVRLMKTNIKNILDGATLSAKRVKTYNNKRALGLIVSCSARRSVLKQYTEEEIEIVQDILTPITQLVGFYSYGEIAPFGNDLSNSLLHNQTMTITTVYED